MSKDCCALLRIREGWNLCRSLVLGTTILDGIKQTVDPSTTVVFSESPSSTFVQSNNFDVAIYVLGEVPYAKTNGDNLNLTLPMWVMNSMHDQVCVVIKCVVIIVSGRPVVMQPWMTLIDALVAAWLPGMEGKGLAEVLFGDFGFSGKLPRTWFKTTDQLPMNVGDTNYDPLFPYGFGLTMEPVVEGED
ncbi:hypothetical protein Droror1_Dr00004187 [Drosera rotundifolia]